MLCLGLAGTVSEETTIVRHRRKLFCVVRRRNGSTWVTLCECIMELEQYYGYKQIVDGSRRHVCFFLQVLCFQLVHIERKHCSPISEAGLVVMLNGDGAAWSSPMFGADFPVVPFVPNTWGGSEALPTVSTA